MKSKWIAASYSFCCHGPSANHTKLLNCIRTIIGTTGIELTIEKIGVVGNALPSGDRQ
jgi:hypothetical protein